MANASFPYSNTINQADSSLQNTKQITRDDRIEHWRNIVSNLKLSKEMLMILTGVLLGTVLELPIVLWLSLVFSCVKLEKNTQQISQQTIEIQSENASLTQEIYSLKSANKALQKSSNVIKNQSNLLEQSIEQNTQKINSQEQQLAKNSKKVATTYTSNRLAISKLQQIQHNKKQVSAQLVNQQQQLNTCSQKIKQLESTFSLSNIESLTHNAYISIDGNNLYYSLKKLENDISWERFKQIRFS